MENHKLQLEDWLDDLCVRFIINLPQEDLENVSRICFQVEEAQWFYEDFIRPLNPNLPSMNLRKFCLRIFQHCPLLAPFSEENHMKAFEEFMTYKTRVPVRGAIMLNEAMDSAVLVKGWKKGASWSFPRGKINKDEDDLDCAIREVYEETGLDLRDAGLVPERDDAKYIDVTMREQQLRLYVFRNVPMDTHFAPRTRKEISKIEWYKLSELPAFRKNRNHSEIDAAAATNKFYMVAPFLVPLKKWVKQQQQQKKKDESRHTQYAHLFTPPVAEEVMTEEEGPATTEPVMEPPRTTSALDTMEDTNRELQRRLIAQPPTQGLQASAPTQVQDKGGALLAMLQSRNEPSLQQQTPQPSRPVPHTPLDLLYNVAPEPQRPHHHHPTQRLPPSGYQAPPSFSIPPNTIQRFAGYHGTPSRPPVQIMQRRAENQQAHFNMRSQPLNQPVLVHPQPLPRQANHLLAGAMVSTPQAAGHGAAYGHQHVKITGQSGGMRSVPSQDAANVEVQPELNSSQQALLNAFTKDGGHPKEVAQTSFLREPPPAAARRPSQQQPMNWGSLTSTYATQPPATFPAQNGMQPVQATAEAALRAKPVPETRRKALLDIFKTSTPSSPAQNPAKVDVKDQNVMALPIQGVPQHQPTGSSSAETNFTAAQANGGPAQVNQVKLPFDALSLLTRPNQAGEKTPLQPVVAQPRMSSAPLNPVLGTSVGNLGNTYTSPGPRSTQFNGSPYQNPAYMALPSPQAMASFPNVTPLRQESTSKQQQKLMSLFTKPQVASAGPIIDDKGKGKESVRYDLGRLPTPHSHISSLAVAGVDGSGGGIEMSRRSSQAPISPENEQFLLNYLKSVSSTAHH